MTLQERLDNAEREADTLRRILAAYPDAKEEPEGLTANVPISDCTEVNVYAVPGGACFVRLGAVVGSRTVWRPQKVDAEGLLTRILEHVHGPRAIESALIEMAELL